MSAPSIGVVFPADAPAAVLPEFARKVEALGYSELWVIEDCFLSGGLTLAATALTATKTLRVGVGLLPAAVRNAAIVSMEIATLAAIHPGRLTVAFGHGVDSWMRQIGARPRNRVVALQEMVSTVKTLLAGGLVTCSGELVSLEAVKLDNVPEVTPPILVGTTGPQGLRVARESSDGVLLPEGCGAGFIETVAGQLGAGDADGAESLEVVAYAWLRFGEDGPDHPALAAAVSNWRNMGLFPTAVHEAGISEASDDAEATRKAAQQLAVTGPAVQCAGSAQRLLDAGLSRLILAAVGADYVEQYELFAEHAMPLLTSELAER